MKLFWILISLTIWMLYRDEISSTFQVVKNYIQFCLQTLGLWKLIDVLKIFKVSRERELIFVAFILFVTCNDVFILLKNIFEVFFELAANDATFLVFLVVVGTAVLYRI